MESKQKIIKGMIFTFITLLVMYLGVSFYFMNHFHFRSVVNNVNVAGKTVEEANQQISEKIENYELKLVERNNVTEQIKGTDIDLQYNSVDEVQKIKDNQNPFTWVGSIFSGDEKEVTEGIIYNEEKLDNIIDELTCLTSENIIEPENASFKYENGEFIIVDEVQGNRVNKDELKKQIVKALSCAATELDLDSSRCYEEPEYDKNSDKVKKAKEELDKYGKSKITFTVGENEEILDGSIISEWLEVDDDLNVIFNEDLVDDYVYSLASKYNTYGSTRSFKTSYGSIVNVSGGEYGWIINKKEQAAEIKKLVKEGKETKTEFIYSQTAAQHGDNDYGNTYVEVSISDQHVWLYVDGSLITEGDVVTGCYYNGTSTNRGVYSIYYKQYDTVLKGEGYESPVTFWMPFNGGIGFHDASWRGQFGGSIYLSNGSHGCVNCPYSLASTLYNYVQAGTPVIVY